MTQPGDKDPLLDALLSEVLGRQTPPDLTARIMKALEAHRAEANGNSPRHLLPLPIPDLAACASAAPTAPPVQTAPAVAPAEPGRHTIPLNSAEATPPPSSTFLRAGIAAAGILVLLTVTWFALRGDNQHLASPQAEPADRPRPEEAPQAQIPADEIAWEENPATELPHNERPVGTPVEFSELPFAPENDLVATPPPSLILPAKNSPPVEPRPEAEIVQAIDAALARNWDEHAVLPSPAVEDSEWCRRVYQRLLAREPAPEEVARFVDDTATDKHEQLVERLLYSEEYAAEYADHWSRVWANVLVGHTAGRNSDRDGLLQYLRQSLYGNKSYDELAQELIVATGMNQPGSAAYNGATNFLLSNLDRQAIVPTGRTSRVFLGRQLQCAQCHDHPLNGTAQHEFWEMNAFFRPLRAVKDANSDIVALQDQGPSGQASAAAAEVYYERPNGEVKVAYPAFGGQPVPTAGADALPLRQVLAERIVQSPQLPAAAVNRLWSLLLGYGFTNPVDDMGGHNPPSHPELLATLSDQFVAHGYDLKKLTAWIVLSDAFDRSTRVTNENVADLPEAGEPPLFSRYYIQRDQPKQVHETLALVAGGRSTASGATSQAIQARRQSAERRVQDARKGSGDRSTFDEQLSPSLQLADGSYQTRMALAPPARLLERLAESELTAQQKVEHLFLAAVGRQPNQRELSLATKLLADSQSNPLAGLQDIWWALLNSDEAAPR